MDNNTQASKSAVSAVTGGGMIFDFDATDAKVEDPKQKSLLDIATAPQGEFDFDFNAGPA